MGGEECVERPCRQGEKSMWGEHKLEKTGNVRSDCKDS